MRPATTRPFSEEAAEAFAFLGECGFRRDTNEANRLSLEGPRASVVVEWEPRSGELTVYIGLRPRSGPTDELFTLDDILAMEAVGVDRRAPIQIADSSKLRPFLDQLAGEIQKYAAPAVSGDRMFFQRLRAFRSARARAFEEDAVLRRIRSAAAEAWKDRDYEKVVSIFEPVEAELSDSERAKLQFAQRHVQQPPKGSGTRR